MSITWCDYRHVASLPTPENDKYRFILYFFATFDEGIKGYLVCIADRKLNRSSAVRIREYPTRANLLRLIDFVAGMILDSGIRCSEADGVFSYLQEPTRTDYEPFTFISISSGGNPKKAQMPGS